MHPSYGLLIAAAEVPAGHAHLDDEVNHISSDNAHAPDAEALASLKADIEIGLRDLAERRVHDLDRSRIEARRKRAS